MALSVGLPKLPANVDAAELVRVGGMCLLDFIEENHSIEGVFRSEGLFNGAASVLLTSHFADFLHHLKHWLSKSFMSYVNLGELGELVERMILMFTVMNASRSKFKATVNESISLPINKTICEKIFEPVGLEDFLELFVGVDATKGYLDKCQDLKGSFVAFGHFSLMAAGDISNDPYGCVANFLSRGAAIIPKPSTEGLDILIPLVLASRKLSFVYIQVKFGKSYVRTMPSATEVMVSSPHNAFKGKLTMRDGTVTPYCYLYHHLSPHKIKTKVMECVPTAPVPPFVDPDDKGKAPSNPPKTRSQPIAKKMRQVKNKGTVNYPITTSRTAKVLMEEKDDRREEPPKKLKRKKTVVIGYHLPCLAINGIPQELKSKLGEQGNVLVEFLHHFEQDLNVDSCYGDGSLVNTWCVPTAESVGNVEQVEGTREYLRKSNTSQ
jgi:hypothetical protein